MKKTISVLAVALIASQAMHVSAQEAVTSDLDSCINSEKLAFTVKGAAAGALTGLMTSFLSGKKENAGRNAVIGAVAGGAIGYVTAYYKAVNICMQKNPSWLPESKIQRNENYKEVVKEFKYKPSMGDFVRLRKLQASPFASPGETIEIKAKYVVLTPDGGEAKIKVERKLFAIDGNNKEEELPLYGIEERVVANGEYTEEFPIKMAPEATKDISFRIEYRISLKDAAFVTESIVVKVK